MARAQVLLVPLLSLLLPPHTLTLLVLLVLLLVLLVLMLLVLLVLLTFKLLLLLLLLLLLQVLLVRPVDHVLGALACIRPTAAVWVMHQVDIHRPGPACPQLNPEHKKNTACSGGACTAAGERHAACSLAEHLPVTVCIPVCLQGRAGWCLHCKDGVVNKVGHG